MIFLLLRKSKMSQKGFTLVEVLVSIGIFSVIIVSLYTVFSNGLYLHQKSEDISSVYQDVRWTLDVLTRDLQRMVLFTISEEYAHIYGVVVNEATEKNVMVEIQTPSFSEENPARGSFVGQPSSLSLVLPDATGLKFVRYYLQAPEEMAIYQTERGGVFSGNRDMTVYSEETRPEVQYLIREERRLSAATSSEEEAESVQEILSVNVLKESLNFFYADRDEENQGAEAITWSEEWNKEAFPLGVRMTLTYIDPGEAQSLLTLQKDIFVPLGNWPR